MLMSPGDRQGVSACKLPETGGLVHGVLINLSSGLPIRQDGDSPVKGYNPEKLHSKIVEFISLLKGPVLLISYLEQVQRPPVTGLPPVTNSQCSFQTMLLLFKIESKLFQFAASHSTDLPNLAPLG